MIIKHTGEFDLAYRFINETNQNIFLTGKAGTGKTTFLKYLRENTLKKSVVAAPTGVAAINARGVTLHSLFQLPLGIIIPEANPLQFFDGRVSNQSFISGIHYNREKLDLLRSMELLIIDEASMVASYMVDAIDSVLRYVRRQQHKPFGGVQVLFIGDLYQLPPVVKNEEWEILKNYYTSIFFFNSFILRNNIPIIIELTEIFRQKDGKFIEILNGIRNNNLSNEGYSMLSSRLRHDFVPRDDEEYITLTTHNFQSNEINQKKLNSLSGRLYTFNAEIKDIFPEHNFPAEKALRLKKGAQVMFLKNDTEGKQYFNGKIGIITKIDEESIKVKGKDDFQEITVKKTEWQNVHYKIDADTNEITDEVLGSFFQYPLRLAWAITIHKSQGLTFDRLIIDAERAFATGQVYVALSRCTSLEGLILKTPVRRNFLGAHKDFKEWHSENKNEDLSSIFIESRKAYIREEILNIFTWKTWYYELKALSVLLTENREITGDASITWIEGLMNKQRELYEVSEKFKQVINRLNMKSDIEDNDILRKRLNDGSNYFYDEILNWIESFLNHPLIIRRKQLALKIDEQLLNINQIMEEILYKIEFCKNDFLPDKYLIHKKSFVPKSKIIKSTYSKTSKSGNTIAETVALFRKTKSIPLTAEIRSLAAGTIEGHLAKAIRHSQINIEEIISIDEVKKISKYFAESWEDTKLAPIKEKIPFEVSFGILRMVLAWLHKEEK